MECKFTTTAKNSFQEFKKFGWTLFKKAIIIRSIIMMLVFIAWGIFINTAFFYIGIPLVALIEYFSFMRPLKKSYYSNKLAADAQITYEFYDDFFIKKGVSGDDKINYADLYKIVETKTNFYLMLGNNYACLLIKRNFPEGLSGFLRTKKM